MKIKKKEKTKQLKVESYDLFDIHSQIKFVFFKIRKNIFLFS